MPEIKPVAGVAQSIAASGLRAQQARMRIIAENLANADSTSKTPGGDPYRRQAPVFEPTKIAGAQGVRMAKVQADPTEFRQEYDPGHPSADAKGYVKLPNVNSLIEMSDMREAQRSYEANLRAIEVARNMLQRTIDLIR